MTFTLRSTIHHLQSTIHRGFTLIELLIVIAIIGILTALVTTNLQGARSRARDTRRKSDLRAIEQSLRLYYNDNKSFPSSDSGNIKGCGTLAVPTTCSWGGAFSVDSVTDPSQKTIYMSSLPLDPQSGTNTLTYTYVSTSPDQYMLIATLENGSDTDAANSQTLTCKSLYNAYSGNKNYTDFVLCAQ